jgi:Fe-S-cluster containining protein
MSQTAKQDCERVDKFVSAVFSQPQNKKPCCTKGCHACCSELVIASNAEVDYILEGMSEAHRAEVTGKLTEWLEKIKPMLGHDAVTEGMALQYRELNAPCPLLKHGLCSVYDRRPMGCRVYFALEKPENCEGAGRENQMFAKFPDELFKYLGPPAAVKGHLVLEHLGLLLAERLLGIKLESGSRQEVQFV